MAINGYFIATTATQLEKMSPLRLLLLFIVAAKCMLCFVITIEGSVQRIYNPVDPETVKLECLHSKSIRVLLGQEN